jgi:cytochrome b subunit of formate dehydrogenase
MQAPKLSPVVRWGSNKIKTAQPPAFFAKPTPAMLGHIYIGTVGIEGAFEAMGEGTVDVNWAREHHRLWLEDEIRRSPKGARAQPAE